jgi:hypothetical protein
VHRMLASLHPAAIALIGVAVLTLAWLLGLAG